MKKLLLIICVVSTTLLPANELKYYSNYIELLKKNNLDIKIQEEKIAETLLQIEQKQSIFRSPLSFEAQITNGKYQQPYNLITNDYPSTTGLYRYSLGISKSIYFTNLQKTEREMAQLQMEIEKIHKEQLEKQIVIHFRNSYFSIIFLNLMKEHLKEHINKFENLKRRFGNYYFDKKIGTYTTAALNMGIRQQWWICKRYF